MGTDAALECNCSLVCGRALRSGSSHGCSLDSSWFQGDDYVSKALVGIILGRIRARQEMGLRLLVSYRTLATFHSRGAIVDRREAPAEFT